MDSAQVRAQFIAFFKERGHTYAKPSPLLNRGDDTLLFVNSGMVQFKGILLGHEAPTAPRLANSQPCLRIAGKHNDLEDVGLDTYHHTFFEMLGHWSFGDYFKKGAIDYAWELLTEVFKLPKDRLYATIFEGSQEDGLAEDEESQTLWRRYLPSAQILKGSKKDNFWEVGAQGPCGPCTEVHIDLRSDEARKQIPGRTLVNQDHPEVIEIGNWVFIQYNRLASGQLVPLPSQHVDNGIGFERLCMALQGKRSTYDTDLFVPLLNHLAEKVGTPYGTKKEVDIAMRVIVDHIRALVFTIAEGLLPSSQKEGYVVRRLLRRAVRYGYSFLDFNTPFLYQLVPLVVKTMGVHYPHLAQQAQMVQATILQEEKSFLHTLAEGMGHLEQIMHSLPKGNPTIEGEAIFTLYDRYGFPYDLTALVARERGYQLDQKGFEEAMQKQKTRSKVAAKELYEDWIEVSQGKDSEFVGYDLFKVSTTVRAYRKVEKKGERYYQLVLDQTPFYPEGGGQVGDQGQLTFGKTSIEVLDTKRENERIVHYTKTLPPSLSTTCIAEVDLQKRQACQRNHSATHLLQAALKEELGDHIMQRGSLVTPQGLRFDFSHGEKIEKEVLIQIEKKINHYIRQNIQREEVRDLPLAEAEKRGAIGLFTEKYGEKVRVIGFQGADSLELCGGTHVATTGEIGYCKIISEKSIGTGVRRMEAITGEAVGDWTAQTDDTLQLLRTLPSKASLKESLHSFIENHKKLQKRAQRLSDKLLTIQCNQLKAQLAQQGVKEYVIADITLEDVDALKKLFFTIKKSYKNSPIILVAHNEKEVALAIGVPPASKDNPTSLSALRLLQTLSPYIQAKGGGNDQFAFAKGNDSKGVAPLLTAARKALTL